MQQAITDQSKLAIAKNFVRGGVSSSELASLMNLLAFEKNRLALAKFGYAFTSDKHNFHVVNRAFMFDSSVRELNRFIRNRSHR
jgi:hypothetical protein